MERNIPTHAVKAVITNDAGQILFVLGSKHNLWDLPGGLVEPGEDDVEALARELREELGIEPIIGKELGRWTFHRPLDGKTVHVTNYEVRATGINLSSLSHEHTQGRWVTRTSIDELATKDPSLLPALGA